MNQSVKPLTQSKAVWLCAAAAISPFFAGCGGEDPAAEAAAAARLKELGALVVMDGAREHVASVNFAAIRDEEKRAAAFEQLTKLPYLAALDISRTNPTAEHLKGVASAKRLRSLTASGVPLTDDGAKLLSELSGVESLQLAGSEITSEGLAALCKCRQVKVLNLSGSNINGGLEPLSRLPELNWLVLNDVTVEDDSLAALANAGSLARLSLNGSSYPTESLDRLAAAKPAMQIDRDPAESPAETESAETESAEE